MSPVTPTPQRLKEMASALKSLVNRLDIASWLLLKPTSKNSQTSISTNQTNCSNESNKIQKNNKEITVLNFRESVHYAKDNSDLFLLTYQETIKSLKRHFHNHSISKHDYPIFSKIDDDLKRLIFPYEF